MQTHYDNAKRNLYSRKKINNIIIDFFSSVDDHKNIKVTIDLQVIDLDGFKNLATFLTTTHHLPNIPKSFHNCYPADGITSFIRQTLTSYEKACRLNHNLAFRTDQKGNTRSLYHNGQ